MISASFCRGSRWIACAAIGTLAAAHAASAQSIPGPGPCDSGTGSFSSCRIHVVVSTTIQPTRLLTVEQGTQFALTPATGNLTAADLNAGFVDSPGSITMTVSSNSPWRLTARAASATMSGACASKAANSIQFGTSSATRTTPLSTTDAVLATGGAGSVNVTRSLFLRVALSWLTDSPVSASNCGLPLSLSVSAP